MSDSTYLNNPISQVHINQIMRWLYFEKKILQYKYKLINISVSPLLKPIRGISREVKKIVRDSYVLVYNG